MSTRGVMGRVDHPGELLLPVLLALLAAVGWLAEPLLLAGAIAGQLALGGLGAVYLLGPARPGLGFARYATPAVAAVAATLFGRLLPGGVSLLLVPVAAAVIWAVVHVELRTVRASGSRTTLDLLLTAVLFAAAAGIDELLAESGWPPPIVPTGFIVGALALRQAEARGRTGAEAIGQALLHTLGVIQVALAVELLDLPEPVGAAIAALAFYAWGGAADSLEQGARGRAVAVEFGSLAALGMAVAVLLHGS
ncbi:MAG TPA: hypothetical protein VHK06_03225 [Candidatus Limnocylindria bacterium]|nr:hypothetical protein [Candidatus Limnocylindria bacterium]